MKYLFIGLLLPVFGLSQESTNFIPLIQNESNKQLWQSAIKERYNQDIKSLNGKHIKELEDIYKERFEYINEKFTSSEILSTTAVTEYLNDIADVIFTANPFLPKKDIRIIFSRSPVPNASSMGEGTIFFNIGLFHRMQNEAQVAFVLCHELAHYYQDHGNNSIHRYVNTIYSADFQKQLKRISKTEYKRNEQLEGLAKNFAFRSRRHSREFELEADSLAISWMSRTPYNIADAVSCLEVLDAADKEKYTEPLSLETKFGFSHAPFKRSWLEKEELLFSSSKEDREAEDVLEDSLKTHPACKLRIERSKELINSLSQSGKSGFVVDESKFLKARAQFDFEIIEYCYETNRVSRSLFYSLKMLNIFPDNAYLVTMVGKCLNRIYINQKNHELSKIVDLPGPAYDNEYNDLLTLIQNIRLAEIANLSYNFLSQYESKLSSYSDFRKEFNTSKTHSKK